MDVFILNDGCVKEDTLTQSLKERLKAANHTITTNYKTADILVYTTCAGTGPAIDDCIRTSYYFSIAKKKESILIITGCSSSLIKELDFVKNREDIKIIENKDFVVPITNYINEENKRTTKKISLEHATRKLCSNDVYIQFMLEDGCANKCSFCKQHYYPKKVESIEYYTALNYLKEKIRTGTKIIALSGENTTLYGLDLYKKQVLHEFIHDLSMEEDLKYIILNEITVQNMYKELLEEIANNPKVIDVTIQLESASDKLLTAMNRGHNLEKYDFIVRRLQEKGKVINTILMSGFPKETNEDIEKTINYINDRNIYVEEICSYEDCYAIPSHEFEQLSASEKRRHLKIYKEAIKKSNYKVLENLIDYPSINAPVVIGHINNRVYLGNTFTNYSIKKDLYELPLGTVIEEKPKRIVKSKWGTIDYNYRY